MKIIGTLKADLESESANDNHQSNNPLVRPGSVFQIYPAAMVDGNSYSARVGNEMYFNSQTPNKKVGDSMEDSVNQLLTHFFGTDRKSINNFLDKEPKTVSFIQGRIENSNTQILLLERGLIDKIAPTPEAALEERRNALSQVIEMNESGSVGEHIRI